MNAGIETYASTPPQLLDLVPPPTWKQLDGQPLFKYAHWRRVLERSTPALRDILLTCPCKNERKRVVVDVKLAWLNEGENPCLPHWHTDCTMDMGNETRPEIHYIYVAGAGSFTRFLWEPLPVTPDWEAQIRPEMVRTIPEATWVKYGREHLHQCSPAQYSGHRLLIRVTETDLIPYSNKPKGVFHYTGER